MTVQNVVSMCPDPTIGHYVPIFFFNIIEKYGANYTRLKSRRKIFNFEIKFGRTDHVVFLCVNTENLQVEPFFITYQMCFDAYSLASCSKF